ncbi:MAG: hypothetical protein WCK63_13625 [Betaproteobacteria bacterium]
MTNQQTRGKNKTSPHDLTVKDFLLHLDSLPDDRLFSETHAAAMLGKSEKTLQEERRIYNRCREQSPAEAEKLKEDLTPWILAGVGSIRYRLGDLREYIRRRRFGGSMGVIEAKLPAISDGIGIMTYRLANGLLPIAVRGGELLDFIETSDEEVDAVEMMPPDEIAFITASGLRIAGEQTT